MSARVCVRVHVFIVARPMAAEANLILHSKCLEIGVLRRFH